MSIEIRNASTVNNSRSVSTPQSATTVSSLYYELKEQIALEIESKNKEINRLREMIGYLQGVLFKNGIDVNTHLSVKRFK